MFTRFDALMEICILIVLTFALLAWCVGVNRCLGIWICSGCGQEFIAPGTPTRYPCCGEVFSGSGGEVDDDVTEYTCFACGKRTEMLAGEEMEPCPHCWKEIS